MPDRSGPKVEPGARRAWWAVWARSGPARHESGRRAGSLHDSRERSRQTSPFHYRTFKRKIGTVRPGQTFVRSSRRRLRWGVRMTKLSVSELKRARLVPSSAFASPDEVLGSPELSRAQKIAILRRWEFDSRPTTPPAMVRQDGPILDQIRQALRDLGAGPAIVGRGSATRH